MKRQSSRMTPGACGDRNEASPALPVLPSIEALTSIDDGRLLAELEICRMMEKLARLRALVMKAHALVTSDPTGERADSRNLARST